MPNRINSPFSDDISFAAVSSEAEYHLQAEEQALLSARATPQRREQFRLGRAAAARALNQFGFQLPPAILKGPRGEPIWPAAVVGSISHTAALAVAAVANSSDYRALGLDLQVIGETLSLSKALLQRIATNEEQVWILKADQSWQLRAIMLFSAKESVFKGLYPLLRREIGFKQAKLSWSEEQQAFRVSLEIEEARNFKNLTVTSHSTDQYVLTGLAIKNLG